MNDGKELKGIVTQSIDYKGRITLRNFKPIIGERVILFDSRDGDCIDVYQEKDFEDIFNKIKALKDKCGAKFVRDAIRYFSVRVFDQKEIDKELRVQIPKKAVDKLGLKGKAVIVGKSNKLSIYSEEAYKNHIKVLTR